MQLKLLRSSQSHENLSPYIIPDFSLVAFERCHLVAREGLVYQDLSHCVVPCRTVPDGWMDEWMDGAEEEIR